MPAFETLELDCDRFGHAAGSFVFEEVVHPRGGKQAADCTDATRQQTLKDLQKRAWDLGNPFLPTFVGPTKTAHWRLVKGCTPLTRRSYSYLTGSMYIAKG